MTITRAKGVAQFQGCGHFVCNHVLPFRRDGRTLNPPELSWGQGLKEPHRTMGSVCPTLCRRRCRSRFMLDRKASFLWQWYTLMSDRTERTSQQIQHSHAPNCKQKDDKFNPKAMFCNRKEDRVNLFIFNHGQNWSGFHNRNWVQTLAAA